MAEGLVASREHFLALARELGVVRSGASGRLLQRLAMKPVLRPIDQWCPGAIRRQGEALEAPLTPLPRFALAQCGFLLSAIDHNLKQELTSLYDHNPGVAEVREPLTEASLTPCKSMEAVTIKAEKAEGTTTAEPSNKTKRKLRHAEVVKAEVKEEEPALVCLPKKAPKAKKAPTAKAPKAPAPAAKAPKARAPAPAPAPRAAAPAPRAPAGAQPAPAPAPRGEPQAPRPAAHDADEPALVCRPKEPTEGGGTHMKKQSGYMFHNAQHRAKVKEVVEAQNPGMPAKEKHPAVMKKLAAMWGKLDDAAKFRYRADAPMVAAKPRKAFKPDPPRLVALPAGTHGTCKRCGESVQEQAVVIGGRRWKVSCFRASTKVDGSDGLSTCKVSGDVIPQEALRLKVACGATKTSPILSFAADQVAPFLGALRGNVAPDALFGGFDSLRGAQQRAFYALFPGVALPERYMSHGQVSQMRAQHMPDFAAMLGRAPTRDPLLGDSDDDDSADGAPADAPPPKRRRIVDEDDLSD